MIEKENRCVCCGAIIPEGKQICYSCEIQEYEDIAQMKAIKEQREKRERKKAKRKNYF